MGLYEDARMILEEYIGVRPGELVTIFTDRSRRDEGEALAAAAIDLGIEALFVDMSATIDRWFDAPGFWLRPPQTLIDLVQASNVSVLAVDETWAFRLDHQVRHLFRTGPECSVFKVDLGMGSWGLTAEDRETATERGRVLMAAFEGGREVHVTTPAGTDLHLSVEGRPCLPIIPVPGRGKPYGMSVPLWSEYNWAPVEDRTHGVAVIDGVTEATKVIHVVDEPIRIVIEGGRAVAITGGADADAFREAMQTDETAAIVGELGLGAHHKALVGTETEKALLGTCHLGFGDNGDYPGGLNRSAVHVDMLMRDVTVSVDGRVVIDAGRVVGFDA
jgi:2,5-dihydroxypyridine 5,6-dioxygenase